MLSNKWFALCECKEESEINRPEDKIKNDRPGDDGTLRSVYLLVFLLGVIDLAPASASTSASASFGISCHLAFHVIWRFMSFGVSCHLAFHVIWRFM